MYSATSATPREENESNLTNIANYGVLTNRKNKFIIFIFIILQNRLTSLTHIILPTHQKSI